jgi:hypothetical protein
LRKDKKHLLVAFSIYLVGVILFFNRFQFNINPDAISYFSISKKYFLSHYSEAINGYWGPLYSWIILPSFYLGIEPGVFARLINVIFSFMLLNLIYYYSAILNFDKRTKIISTYFFILPAWFFTFWYVTPDYLLLILTLIYVLILLDENFLSELKITLFSSLIAALMYFTKSYGLIFFLVFQSVVFLIFYLRKKELRKKILLNYIISIIFFLMIISPWVYLISNKYGYFTFSTSGKINLLIVNPDLNFHHPPIENGLIAPSDKYSVSAWDDPDVNLYPEWSPFKSMDDFKFFTFNLLKNIAKFFAMMFLFSPIGIITLIFFRKEFFLDQRILILILAALINGLGYCLIYVENRYIWVSLVLFAMLSFIPIKKLFENILQKRAVILIATFLISLSTIPFILLAFKNYTYDNKAYHYSSFMKQNFDIKGNIASTSNWGFSLSLAHFLESKYFGEEKKRYFDAEFLSKLKKFDIDYLFHYSKTDTTIDGLNFVTKIDSLYLFKVIK